jgi:uncharacterized SAM-binding protein YcdF (DUF218 family)
MPPVPLLVVVLIGTRMRFKRPLLGWLVVLLGIAGVWLSTTQAVGELLTRALLKPPPPLSSEDIAGLRRSPKTAIVVLGGGRRLLAPEYGTATLKPRTVERLRYGLWLGRETGLPVAFSGGVGYGAAEGSSEAESAARMAQQDFGRPLRWLEGESRDTHENAVKSVALMQAQGMEKIVLVTNGDHMRRALSNFEKAAQGSKLQIVPAPMALTPRGRLRVDDWIPSPDGYEKVWVAMHEWLGYLVGA